MTRWPIISSFVAVLAVGCVEGSAPPKGGGSIPTEGGTLRLEQCGYDLTTRVGASAPVIGTPVLGDDPTVRQVHLGIASQPATSMAIQWRTVDETTLASTVQYGTGGNTDQVLEGATFIFIGGFNQSGETIRMHEAHLCGLEPDTEYSYRVGGKSEDGLTEAWSPVYTFRTAPLRSQTDAEVVFGSLGDSRDGYEVWGQFVERLDTMEVDAILFSGDAVTIGAVQLEWETFFDVAEPLLARVPIVSAHGNHDVNAINYYAQFAMPGNEENFSFDFGPAHITVLNDTPYNVSDIQGAAAEFLQADLAANADAPWKILLNHRPLWSASTRHGSDTELLDTWGPIIDAHHVDLVLNGHDHNYERTKPMNGSTPQASPADGTVYVVSGGAGASLYGNGVDFWTELSEKAHSAVVLRLRAELLEMQAFREDGAQLDTMLIGKPSTTP